MGDCDVQRLISFVQNQTRNSPEKMDECEVQKLIFLVQEKRPIYDYTMKEHSNRVALDRLWDDVASEMNIPAADCKSKWANLRSSFCRELRVRQQPGRYKKRKEWYLMEAMSFLTEFVASYNGEAAQDLSSSHETTDSEYSQEFSLFPSNPISEATDTTEKTEKTGKTPKSSDFKKLKLKSRNVLYKKSPSPSSSPLSSLLNFRPQLLEKEKVKDDPPNLAFFRSLLPDMNKLPARRQRHFKGGVLSLLSQMMDQEEDERQHTMMPPHLAVSPPLAPSQVAPGAPPMGQ